MTLSLARTERSILVLSGNFWTPVNAILYLETAELLSSLNDELKDMTLIIH